MSEPSYKHSLEELNLQFKAPKVQLFFNNVIIPESLNLFQMPSKIPSNISHISIIFKDYLGELIYGAKEEQINYDIFKFMSSGFRLLNDVDGVLADYYNDESNNFIGVIEYLLDNMNSILENRRPEIIKCENLLNKYLNGKEVFVYLDNGEIKTHISIVNNEAIISEKELSSGEQKILEIFKIVCTSTPVSIILLDEPELSLSLYWQQMLIEDVLNNMVANKAIIATHSPSLLNEENLKYLIPLYTGERNE